MAKQTAIMAISDSTKPSITRIPSRVNHSNSSVSAAVSSTPMSSGMWNSRFKAMAAPRTSARSQAAIAISHRNHSA